MYAEFHDLDIAEHVPFEVMSNQQRASYLAAAAYRAMLPTSLTTGEQIALAQVYATLAVEDATRESFES